MERIPISRRGKPRPSQFALVDIQDAMRFGQYCWFLDEDGYVKRNMGARGERQRKIYLHREILGLEDYDGICIDHRNGDPLDNRRENLRIATRAENNQNRRRRAGSSRFRGVSLISATGKWQAYGAVNGELTYLGVFEREDEAGRVAREWRREHLPFAVER